MCESEVAKIIARVKLDELMKKGQYGMQMHYHNKHPERYAGSPLPPVATDAELLADYILSLGVIKIDDTAIPPTMEA